MELDFYLKNKAYKPLVSGGMGVDISTSDLALAVASRGGIGHISDAMAPFVADHRYGTRFQNTKLKRFRIFQDGLDKSQVKWSPEEVYEAQMLHVTKTMERKGTHGGIFINIMEKLTMGLPKLTLRARLHAAMEGGIDGITLSAGLHLGTLALMEDHPRFHDVNVGIIVSSARALKVFLNSARKVKRLPDYIVVEGPLAGGHLGFGLDWQNYTLEGIVQDVFKLLREHQLQIPVIPAGGIFTGHDAIRFFAMGAAAVQVATRFTISQECGLPTPVKQKYITAKEEDVVVNMTSPTGYPMRMLRFSPSMTSNIKPNCEALGYILDANGQCAYHQAYEATPCDERGVKLPVTEKMCICYHFMKNQCYTCGHNVFRLKETVERLPNGTFRLPPAVEIFDDYMQQMEEPLAACA